ncbi:rRNA-processing protein [Sparassis crispa]|uniref:rRNA-processing protein n=1 Tax=Sparassis crispa TaxID=139825 RepID=A0A401GM14_9APHY|nr:rRNA-processing protein [Sparassis crispa]GBE83210.1 rRNA-processing protein [Sparassis crispa]
MALTALQKGKSKAALEDSAEHLISDGTSSSASRSADSDSDSDSESESDTDSDTGDEEVTQEFLNALLVRARHNVTAKTLPEGDRSGENLHEEEEIRLDDLKDPEEQPLPPLDPGVLPAPYITLGDARKAAPSAIRHPDIEQVEQASSSNAPARPLPPPELSKSGKPLTKKEKKALKDRTAGRSWYDLPAPAEADLPRLYREVEALRLRNQLDPKRFYRKDEGEGRGIKGLPKYFAIGTIIPSSTPFGTASADNLNRASRKRTLVDELVDDAEAKSYAKKKFKELQTVRGARGRGTLAQKKALRRQKW